MAPLILLACASEEPVVEACETCDGDCEEASFPVGAASHVEGEVDYEQVPPVGGDHAGCWATWGVHDEAVPDETWVHNLEHGGVVFLWDCADCEADVAALNEWVAALEQGSALSTPYPEMDAAFAAVSWGHRLLLGCLDLDAFQAFYDANLDQSPEPGVRVEPTCGDTGETR
ncbi:MAG: DUF3105 domain-containing protein [Myxococcota bacterium]